MSDCAPAVVLSHPETPRSRCQTRLPFGLTRRGKSYDALLFIPQVSLDAGETFLPPPAGPLDTSAMASISEPVTFREFCPLYSLLNAIPTKIQKGFRSIVVYLTALDTNGDYIAVGSSIGMLYLYCRHSGQMKKYNFEVRLPSLSPQPTHHVLVSSDIA